MSFMDQSKAQGSLMGYEGMFSTNVPHVTVKITHVEHSILIHTGFLSFTVETIQLPVHVPFMYQSQSNNETGLISHQREKSISTQVSS